MYIRKVIKKTRDKERYVYRLVETYRTANGPRQRTLLTMNDLNLDESKWKNLADTIESYLKGQIVLFIDDEIRFLAEHYSNLIRERMIYRNSNETEEAKGTDSLYRAIDIHSLRHHSVRTIGAEYLALSSYKELGLDKFFRKAGFNRRQEKLTALIIAGRLVYPSSENLTRFWAKEISAIDTLLDYSFKDLSNNSLYRIADKIYEHKSEIEDYLNEKERDIFNLGESLVFYDLTNTYFEGRAEQNTKAQFGYSKEKRRDCRLVTLGLIIDEYGFPKTSRIMPGNQSEPESLLGMIAQLERIDISEIEKTKGIKKDKTVIMDAGISTEDNLTMLQEYGYDYICVARNKALSESEINREKLKRIVSTSKNSIDVQMFINEKENILYCRSLLKSKKEQSMLDNYRKRFEEELQIAKESLSKKRGTKQYEKVLERIGRIKERNSSIAKYYHINIKKDAESETVQDITWWIINSRDQEFNFSGSYFLKTTRRDLNEEELWNTYTMLSMVEAAFRSLKSELAFRPVYHRREDRSDSHLFIAVLAYHLLNTIRMKLKQKEIHISWERLREAMSTHVVITSTMKTKENKNILYRQTSEAEYFHNEIYQALNLNPKPLKSIIKIL